MASLIEVNKTLLDIREDTDTLNRNFDEWFKSLKRSRLDDLERERERNRLMRRMMGGTAAGVGAAAAAGSQTSGSDTSEDGFLKNLFPNFLKILGAASLVTAPVRIAKNAIQNSVNNSALKRAQIENKKQSIDAEDALKKRAADRSALRAEVTSKTSSTLDRLPKPKITSNLSNLKIDPEISSPTNNFFKQIQGTIARVIPSQVGPSLKLESVITRAKVETGTVPLPTVMTNLGVNSSTLNAIQTKYPDVKFHSNGKDIFARDISGKFSARANQALAELKEYSKGIDVDTTPPIDPAAQNLVDGKAPTGTQSKFTVAKFLRGLNFIDPIGIAGEASLAGSRVTSGATSRTLGAVGRAALSFPTLIASIALTPKAAADGTLQGLVGGIEYGIYEALRKGNLAEAHRLRQLLIEEPDYEPLLSDYGKSIAKMSTPQFNTFAKYTSGLAAALGTVTQQIKKTRQRESPQRKEQMYRAAELKFNTDFEAEMNAARMSGGNPIIDASTTNNNIGGMSGPNKSNSGTGAAENLSYIAKDYMTKGSPYSVPNGMIQ